MLSEHPLNPLVMLDVCLRFRVAHWRKEFSGVACALGRLARPVQQSIVTGPDRGGQSAIGLAGGAAGPLVQGLASRRAGDGRIDAPSLKDGEDVEVSRGVHRLGYALARLQLHGVKVGVDSVGDRSKHQLRRPFRQRLLEPAPLHLAVTDLAEQPGEPLELIVEIADRRSIQQLVEDPQGAAQSANGHPGVMDGIVPAAQAEVALEDDVDLFGQVARKSAVRRRFGRRRRAGLRRYAGQLGRIA